MHPHIPPDARQCAGPRPVITHAGTLTEFIRAHTQATCPSFLYVETRAGERRRRRRRVGVCLGLTPYGCGMQLDLACAKHFRRADVACIHQNVLVLSSECPHRFVRRDLSLPKLCDFLPLQHVYLSIHAPLSMVLLDIELELTSLWSLECSLPTLRPILRNQSRLSPSMTFIRAI